MAFQKNFSVHLYGNFLGFTEVLGQLSTTTLFNSHSAFYAVGNFTSHRIMSAMSSHGNDISQNKGSSEATILYFPQ